MFNVFEQSNQNGVINLHSIRNKTKLPITIQCSQEIGNLYHVETLERPGNVSSNSFLSTSHNKFFVFFCFFFFKFLFFVS